MKKTLLYLMVLLPALGFGQGTYTWDGQANWIPSDPSGNTDTNDVIIVQSGDSAAVISQTTFVDSLAVHPGGKLLVTDSLSVGSSAAVLSDENGYGQLVGEVVGFGLSYEIYLDTVQGGVGRWYNIGLPLEGVDVRSISGVFISDNGHQDSTNLWYYDHLASVSGGVFEPIAEGEALPHTRGYQLYAGGGGVWGTAPFTMRVTGNKFVNDSVFIPASNAGEGVPDWNLIPNPYPSVINWDSVYYANEPYLGATYYIQGGEPDLDDTTNSNITWYMYNATAQDGIGGEADDESDSAVTRFIAPGMSYFVEYQGAATTEALVFTNDMRVLGADTTPHLRSTPKYEQIALTATHTSKQLGDKTFLMFDASFSDQKNIAVDGTKRMNSGYPNLYTQINQESFAFNGLNDQFTTKTVDLHFQGDNDGMYEIALAKDAIPTSWTVELEDKLTDNTVNLRNTTYTFNHVSTNSEDRFLLHIKKGTTDMEEVDTENMFSYMQDQTLNVSMEGVENATVRVYNVTGQLMVEESDVNNSFETGTDDWASGVYLIEVESANGKGLYEDKVVKTSR